MKVKVVFKIMRSLVTENVREMASENSITTLRITTLSIMTFNITLSINGLFMTLSISTLYHFAECHYNKCLIIFIVMLSVVAPYKLEQNRQL